MRLGREHPIKRFAVRAGQPSRSLRMKDSDFETLKALAANASRNVVCNLRSAGQLAQPYLCCNFPRRGRAHQDGMACLCNDPPRPHGQVRIAV